jgi:hypothetical protein
MKLRTRTWTVVGLLAGLILAAAPASAATIDLTASLDCAQANAGAGTCGAGGSGTGSATITFDDVTNTLSWSITWSGLSGTATLAHFHGPALPNQNAGIQVGIGVTLPANGAAVLTDQQETDLLGELWYVNVHTDAFPGGEIRGQVLVVPEPGIAALAGVGLLFLVARGRRG